MTPRYKSIRLQTRGHLKRSTKLSGIAMTETYDNYEYKSLQKIDHLRKKEEQLTNNEPNT